MPTRKPIIGRFVACWLALSTGWAAGQSAREEAVELPRPAGLALLANAVRIEVHRPDGSDWNDTMFAVGSGVVCQGLVLTNNHVAGDEVLAALSQDGDYGRMKAPPRMRLLRHDGSTIPLRGLGFTKEAFADDTASIAVDLSANAGIDAFVRFEDLSPGDHVFTMGNTWSGRFLVRAGHILQLPEQRRSIEDSRVLSYIESVMQDDLGGRSGLSSNRYDRIIITTDISQHGFSGGPVLDRHGRLMGLVIGGSDGDSRWSGHPGDCTFVVPIDAVFRAVGQRSTPGTTPVRALNPSVAPTSTPGPASAFPVQPEPETPIALPESYPVARARPLADAGLMGSAQAWSLNVALGELAGVDEIRWGEGDGAEVLPLVIGPAGDNLPEPPPQAAIAATWSGVDPAVVVIVVGGGAGSQNPPRSAEFSLLSNGQKAWHVLPAE